MAYLPQPQLERCRWGNAVQGADKTRSKYVPKTLYDYTYTNPSGYSYKGQVVADSDVTTYNYVAGQSYNAPGGGSYVISGAGTPTTAPSGAVYTNSYTDATGTYDSYHYDPKNATYYNTNTGYDYKFLYPDGSYYLGKVYDNGTYG